MGCKVVDAKGEVKNLVERLWKDTFDSYTSLRHNVDQTLIAVDSRLRELIGHEAKELQRGVCVALRDAANGVQESFVDALKL